MNVFLHDLFFSARTLRRSPGFSLGVILVMAVGLGAIAAIFGIANEMILRPYPFPDAERILLVRSIHVTNSSPFGVSRLDFEDLKSRSRLFEDLAAVTLSTLNLTDGERPIGVKVGFASPNFFELTGARPLLGRTFDPDSPEVEGVAVLDESLWRRYFAADPEIVGESIRVNSKPYVIRGVVPTSHRFPDEAEIWIPHRVDRSSSSRKDHNNLVLARLREGVSRESADAELAAISQQLAETYVESNKGWEFMTSTLSEFRLGPFAAMLGILGVVATFVMLIACGNVAVILLERAMARQRQLAIRSAFGARQWQLVQVVVADSLILSVLGGLLGLVFAHWFLRLIITSLPPQFSANLHFAIDWRVFAVVFLASAVAAVTAGVAPGLRASRLRLVECLKEGGGGLAQGGERHRLRTVLTVVEIAVSFLLLIAAGLLVRSFLQLDDYDPGHRLDDVVTMSLVLPSDPYADSDRRRALYRDLLRELRSQPGIEAAAAGAFVPFASWDRSTLRIEEGSTLRDDLDFLTGVQRITPGYFETIGLPLLRGRTFEEVDTADTTPVAMINRALAERLWPGQEAIGRRIWVTTNTTWRTVVGVVGNVERVGFAATGKLDYYIPYAQAPQHALRLFVRSAMAPSRVLPQVRQVVTKIAPNVPIGQLETLDRFLADLIAPQRVIGMMLSIFGLSALILTLAGLYGFVSFYVTRRTQEIGLRMALGASATSVMWLVIRRMLVLLGFGVGIGLFASFGLTRSMASFLHGISPLDAATFLAVTVLFATVTALATLGPALRASRLSPMVALRDE